MTEKSNFLQIERADIYIIVEFLIGVALAALANFVLKAPTVASIVLMVGILLTLSTYILKQHVIHEHKRLTECHEKYWDRVKIWEDILGHPDKDIREVGTAIIKKADRELNLLMTETWNVMDPFELTTLVKEAVLQTEQELLCTHIDAKKWTKQSYKELLMANEDRIRQGIKIHRVFVLREHECGDPTVREIVEEHREKRITVEVVKCDEIPPGKCKDFMIFDRKKVIVENLTPDLTVFTDGKISKDKTTIDEWHRVFKGISGQATEDFDEVFTVKQSGDN